MVLEILILIANLCNEDALFVLNNYMDLWRGDEDESKIRDFGGHITFLSFNVVFLKFKNK